MLATWVCSKELHNSTNLYYLNVNRFSFISNTLLHKINTVFVDV